MSSNRNLTCLGILLFVVAFFASVFFLMWLGSTGVLPGVAQWVQPVGEAGGRKMVEKGAKPYVENIPLPSPLILEIPANVKPGEAIQVALRTQPGSTCTIRYINANLVNEPFPQPVYVVANKDGVCKWVWQLPIDSPTGIGTLVLYAGSKSELTYFFNVIPLSQ